MKSFPSTPASKLLQEPKSPIQAAEAPSFAEIHTPTPLPASSRGSSVKLMMNLLTSKQTTAAVLFKAQLITRN